MNHACPLCTTVYINYVDVTKGGAMNWKVGRGGVNALEGRGGGVNTVKTLNFEKKWGVHTI